MLKWLKYTFLLSASMCLWSACQSDKSSTKESTKIIRQKSEVDTLIVHAAHLSRNEDSMLHAVNLLERALVISKRVNYVEGIIKSSNDLGATHSGLLNLVKGSGYFHSALKNAELQHDTMGISRALFGLGVIMYSMNSWDEAIQYFEKVQLVNSVLPSNASTHSNTHYLLGLCNFRLGNIEKAKLFYNESSRLAEEIGLDHRKREIRLSLNNTKTEVDNWDSTLLEYDNLIIEFKEFNQKVGMCFALEGKARYYLKLGKPNLAAKTATESLNLAKQIKIIYPLQSILATVTEAEYKNSNYQAAAAHMLELQGIRDSLHSLTSSAKVTMMGAEYEFDKKKAALDATIKNQEKQRFIWLIVASVLFSIIVLIFYLLRNVSKERKKSDELLLNILPKETAAELKKFGKAEAKFHENISIVFADIKGFTQYAEGLKPSVLVKMLDTYFRVFDEVIDEFNLEKIKTIGDAYMFISGFHNQQDSASNAVRASLKMLKRVGQIKEKMDSEYGLSFDFRFGMHTGNVVSGVVGDKKYAFDVWGDAVNIAARMEESSLPGKLNISQDTFSMLKEQEFESTYRGEVLAKNKGKIPMYFIE